MQLHSEALTRRRLILVPRGGEAPRAVHASLACLVSRRRGACCRERTSCVALVGLLTAGPGYPESHGPDTYPLKTFLFLQIEYETIQAYLVSLRDKS